MKVLLVRYESESAEILTFLLEAKLKAEVHRAATSQKATEILLNQGSFDLIILDDKHDPNNSVLNLMKKAGAQIPYILITSRPFPEMDLLTNPSLLGFVDRTKLATELPTLLENAIEEGTLYQGENQGDYCRVKTELLLRTSPLKADIYVKLNKNHFVKLFRTGNAFTLEQFEIVRFDKNLEYLYLRSDSCTEFLEKLSDDLERLIEAESIPASVVHNLSLSTQETIMEATARMGFTEEVKKLVRQNVRLTLKAIGRNPQLSKAIAKLERDGTRFLSSHSMLIAHVACSIAALLGWPSESTFQKLTYAAMLHDLSLAGTSIAEQGLTECLESIKPHLSPTEFQAFRNHPLLSVRLLKGFDGIPADVDIIIEQHHEKPYGTGFPLGLTAMSIAPLSSVFIIAHEISDCIYRQGIENFSLSEFLEKNSAIYSSNHFKQISKALHDNLKASSLQS